jgi:predicted phage tail protein
MTNVTIHGKLGKIYGKNHKFKIRKMSEIIPAINANSPGFKHKILGDFKSGYHYYFVDPKNPDKKYDRPEVFLNAKPPEEIHIVPAILGAGPVALIVGGIGLGAFSTTVGATLTLGTTKIALADILMNIAISFVIQGISAILFPPPEPVVQQMESQIDTSSYIFSSLQNTATQGFPIPLVYGELRVGSNIVSTNVVSEDMSRKT